MMYWANLLHFYQPYGQKRHIIDAIVAQCYRPVGEGILAHPEARLTIDFPGGLLDQLAAYGYQDVIDLYAEAGRRGQVEFVGSAKYHAILPLLPEGEARRQIELNDETNRRHLGDAYQRRGLFLPEMAWSPELAPVLEQAGIDWVMLDELAYDGHVNHVDYTQTYQVAGTQLRALFREHRLSATIMSAAPRDVSRLKEAAREELQPNRYIVTGMDGETFGHHRVGHEQLLFGMFRDPDIQMVLMSEVFEKFPRVEKVDTVACTWASSEDDITKGVPYISWSDPSNNIHKLQWELVGLAVKELDKLPPTKPEYPGLRQRLDHALASDQFFWAAARPWWMIEHIERGAHELVGVIREASADAAIRKQGLGIYHEIMSLAYDWQRSGKIDNMRHHGAQQVRVPFKEQEDDPKLWQAVLELMQEEEQGAAARGDYEEAILWRDAVYKLEHKLDIYEGLYVMDLLNKKLPDDKIRGVMEKYKQDFDHIRGGQVEQRSN
jgi:hypothetical protein